MKLQAAQQTAAEATWRADDMERRLGRNAVELENIKAEFEKRNAEIEAAEAEWREQLDSANALTRKLDAAWTTAVERNRCYEAELTGLRLQCDKLEAKLGPEASAAVEFGKPPAGSGNGTAHNIGGKKQSAKRSRADTKIRKTSANARKNGKSPVTEPSILPESEIPTETAPPELEKAIQDQPVPIQEYNFAHVNGEPARPRRPLPKFRFKK